MCSAERKEDMDKGYYEFLVEGKPGRLAKFAKEAFIVLGILTLVLSLVRGNMVLIVLAVVFGVAAYYSSKFTDVEYEYLLLDKELSVDKIYNKERRKKAESFDLDKAIAFAPEKSSKTDRYSGVKDLKVTDYSSAGEKEGLKLFEMYYEGGRKVLFSLDEEMIKAFKNKCPRVFSEY
mgnify:CR=1 FL=1